MKKILLLTFGLALLPRADFAQLSTFFVAPALTDTGYAVDQDSNYVAYDSAAASNGKLLFFIGGTGSHTADFTEFVDLAATLGYHCVVVAYRDTPEVATICKNSPDSLCYSLYRQQVCFGTPVSTAAVDTLNSLVTRMQHLLVYLAVTYPTQGWGQFLSGGLPVWGHIAISGHSQGSGHAMYIAKQMRCDRVLMFSGADDYSLYYSAPSPWLSWPSATIDSSLYGFLSLGNENIPYSEQYIIQQVMGVTVSGDSVDADIISPPYRYSHCLYTDLTPLHTGTASYHCSTVCNFYAPLSGTTPVYIPVWTYMLTDTGAADTTVSSTGIAAVTSDLLSIYPDPATDHLMVSYTSAEKNYKIEILDMTGRVLGSCVATGAGTSISLINIAGGNYLVRLSGNETSIIKEFVKM